MPRIAQTLKLVRRVWMGFVHALGVVQNFILLTLVYHVVLGPLALCMRLVGRDLLDMRPGDRSTFYNPKEKVPTDLERCERQF